MIRVNSILEAYLSLCDAIVYSGKVEHDVEFLNSEWCKLLESIVYEYSLCNGERKIADNNSTKIARCK